MLQPELPGHPYREGLPLGGLVPPPATSSIHSSVEFVECIDIASIELFVALRDRLPHGQRLMLTPYTPCEYIAQDMELFLAANQGGGYALKPRPDGVELVSVFSLPGNRLGRLIIEDSLLRGATLASCFDLGKLPSLYQQFGLREYERIGWNETLAPVGWDYRGFGTPDVIEMRLAPHHQDRGY
jgi:hypothetical protein